MHLISLAALMEAVAPWLALLGLMIACAVVVFIDIQAYRNDPDRKVRNAAWFAKFEENLRARYQDPGLAWRTNCFQGHFDSQH
jgi:hypothetical protein